MSNMPEIMEIMETIDSLIEHDLTWLHDEAAMDKVIRRLTVLGWEKNRARTATEWAMKEWHS